MGLGDEELDNRIRSYLDQLENPLLNEHEVTAIKEKIRFLESLRGS